MAKKKSVGGLILFHGAGGNRDHHLFLALEDELDQLGIAVHRINFPYRKLSAGRRPPDRMPKLVAAVNEAVVDAAAEWKVKPTQIVVGGRSMGGRAASMAIAEGMSTAGLLLLSYPLHPPKKPEKLRVEHFGNVRCPVLLIQGKRDPFGTPEEFARHLPELPGPVTEYWIDANHDPKSFDVEIVDQTKVWLEAL